MTSRPVSQAFSVLRLDALGLTQAGPPFAGAVAAIGNFDGLHLGHCAVLHAARTVAEGLGAPTVMLTFEPHPRAYFRPDQPLFRLTPEPLKLALAERMGLSGAVVLTFDAALAGTSATDFN
jgi:riboflavin kinase/FMN adenylyltransferase